MTTPFHTTFTRKELFAACGALHGTAVAALAEHGHLPASVIADAEVLYPVFDAAVRAGGPDHCTRVIMTMEDLRLAYGVIGDIGRAYSALIFDLDDSARPRKMSSGEGWPAYTDEHTFDLHLSGLCGQCSFATDAIDRVICTAQAAPHLAVRP
jgi:hypothetical protein